MSLPPYCSTDVDPRRSGKQWWAFTFLVCTVPYSELVFYPMTTEDVLLYWLDQYWVWRYRVYCRRQATGFNVYMQHEQHLMTRIAPVPSLFRTYGTITDKGGLCDIIFQYGYLLAHADLCVWKRRGMISTTADVACITYTTGCLHPKPCFGGRYRADSRCCWFETIALAMVTLEAVLRMDPLRPYSECTCIWKRTIHRTPPPSAVSPRPVCYHLSTSYISRGRRSSPVLR